MTNLAWKVWKVLDDSPNIRTNLSRGLINVRALAKYIIKERKIDSTVDAVISAIRRYDLGINEKIYENAHNIIRQTTTITTKSPIASISLIKDTENQGSLPHLFSIIHYSHGDVLRIIQAEECIKVFVDEKNLEIISDFFPEEKIVRIDRNLGEINVHMHPDGKYTLGIVAITSNELAINGVNVLEAMSCFPEWLWFIEEKDILKAYKILYRLWQKNQKPYLENDQAT